MKLKKIRQAANMTQTVLANKIGVTQASVAMWETGEAKPTADKLIKLSEVLGCTVDELLRKD